MNGGGKALGKVAASCVSTRRRYASDDWVPDAGWPDIEGRRV